MKFMSVILIYTHTHSHVISNTSSNSITVTIIYTLHALYSLGGSGGDVPPTATTDRQITVATKVWEFNPAISSYDVMIS